jgi:hypothetical protein
MDCFVHNANIELYRRLIAESERNPSRDEDRHKMLLMLLAEEEAKEEAGSVRVSLGRKDFAQPGST